MRWMTTVVVLGVLFSTVPSEAARRSASLERRLSTLGADDEVPVLLRFADRADLARFAGRRADGRTVIEALRAKADVSQRRLLAWLRAQGLSDRSRSLWIDNSIMVRIPARLLPELERFEELDVIDFDEPVVGFGGAPQAPGLAAMEWNLPMIRADLVWSTYGSSGTGIVVGSMDTGFDPGHPALAGKWRGGTNSWHDVINGGLFPYDDHGHGTHTIGTMVGGDGPGSSAAWDIGVAYNAKFIATKVLDANNSFSSASIVLTGAQWMLDPDDNPMTDDFPHVINNSWMFFDPLYQGFHGAVAAWRAVGIIPVFCMGNSGPGSATTRVPGSYDNTIGVGATDSEDVIAPFSSRGPTPVGAAFPADQRKPDISAPGASVLSCVPGGFYSHWSGTSMASPHVAGTVALMLQAHPGMSFDEVRTALVTTTVDHGLPGFDYEYGYGRLDAFDAVTAALAPSAHVTAGTLGPYEINVNWNSVPGAIRYDVYRSALPQDPEPELIASTTDTTLTDSGRFGRFYYRLRTISASGESPFTNEASATSCGLDVPDVVGTDGQTASPSLADFNGDGVLDVALASLTTASVKVALGDGAGGFGPIASFPAGTRPAGVVAADFNDDGIPDLAVGNNLTPGALSVLLGNGSAGHGDGTFGAPVAYVTAARPIGILAADFDQDGITDLGVACNGGNAVSILRGNGTTGAGDGTFAERVDYATATRPTAIVTGDWNRDGALDLATTANGSARVSILLGERDAVRATGTFTVGTPAFTQLNPIALATGDFNADGRVDLAVACNQNPGFVSILLGRDASEGESVFSNGIHYAGGPSPQGIATGDMNGDGIADLAVAAASGGSIGVLLGTGSGGVGDGGFEKPALFAAVGTPTDVVVTDLDGNGAPDLAMANLSGPQALSTMLASCIPDVGTELSLVAPSGGESWPVSTVQNIIWSKGPGVVSVNIDVSRDHRATWERIATGWIGTSFPWIVTEPSTGAAAAYVRVSDPRVSQADTSDAALTIGPDYRISVPGRDAVVSFALDVPNPSRHGLRVRFRIGREPSATLEVIDIGGRRVRSRAVGGMGAGEHTLDLGAGLRPGIYVVRLTQGSERITRKAAVVR